MHAAKWKSEVLKGYNDVWFQQYDALEKAKVKSEKVKVKVKSEKEVVGRCLGRGSKRWISGSEEIFRTGEWSCNDG